jgi:hypothetical protein
MRYWKTLLYGVVVVAAMIPGSCVLFTLPTSSLAYTEVPEVNYPAGSFWNEQLPADHMHPAYTLDPKSDLYIEAMANEHRRDSGTLFELVLVVEGGSVPIYYADADDPRVSVPISTAGYGARGVTDVPIPSYALPDSATDGHIAIIDTERNIEYDFWQFRKERGRWVSSAAALMDLSTNSVHEDRFSVAASGFPLSAGLIWPEELLDGGVIDHALVFAYPLTRDHAFVSPATRSDGPYNDEAALPLGAHVILDPELDLDALDPPLNGVEMKIATALQEYGAYLYDTGSPGSIIELNAVNPRSYSSDPYVGLPRYEQGGGYLDVGNIPVDKFQVLELGPIETWGAPYPSDIAFEEYYYGVE